MHRLKLGLPSLAIATGLAIATMGCDGLFADLGQIPSPDSQDAGPSDVGDADATDDADADEPPDYDCDEDGTPFGGGDGEEDPYLLCSPEHITELSQNWEYFDAHFVLTEDIDLDGVPLEPIGSITPQPTGAPFTGYFDGNGYVLENFSLDVPTGFFAYVGEDGKVGDIHLKDVDVEAPFLAAGLAGQNDGTITGCHVSGSIESFFAGGVAADNNGTIRGCTVDINMTTPGTLDLDALPEEEDTGIIVLGGLVAINAGTITRSMVEGSVTSEITIDRGDENKPFLGVGGGLAGRNIGSITTSSSSAQVVMDLTIERSTTSPPLHELLADPEESLFVGGLLGVNDGELIDTYATGKAEAHAISNDEAEQPSTFEVVGGLVGINVQDNSPETKVENSYASGPVDGGFSIMAAGGDETWNTFGGFIGINGVDDVTPPVESCYWDVNTSEQDVDDSGAEPLSSDPGDDDLDEFGDEDSFEGWDFDGTWTIGQAPDELERPIFRWQRR